MYAVLQQGGSLAILVVNKQAPAIASSQSVTITISGFNPAAQATVYSYGIPQDTAASQGQTGSAIDVANSTISVAPSFVFAANAYSVNAIVIPSA